MKKKDSKTDAIDYKPDAIDSMNEIPSSVVSMTEYTGMLATIPEDREAMLALRSILPTPSASVATESTISQRKKTIVSKKSKPQK